MSKTSKALYVKSLIERDLIAKPFLRTSADEEIGKKMMFIQTVDKNWFWVDVDDERVGPFKTREAADKDAHESFWLACDSSLKRKR